MLKTNKPFITSQVSAHGLWSLGLLGWTLVGSALAHAGLLVVLSQTPIRSSLLMGPSVALRLGDHAVQVKLTTRHVAAPEPTADMPSGDLFTPTRHEALEIDLGISDRVIAIVEIVVSPHRQVAHDASGLVHHSAQDAPHRTESLGAAQQQAAPMDDLARPTAPRVRMPTLAIDAAQQVEQFDASDPSTAGVKTGAQMVNLPAVRYPLVSRRRGEEGLVVLRVQVRADGRVGRIDVVRDAGHRRLRAAAIDAVRRARFRPAQKNGRAVESEAIVPIRFRLGER